MKTEPEVTIIVVNWNTRDMTLDCLRSVYEQTVDTAFEVILVDNGSHDGSAEAIAKAYPQVRLMAEQHNHGFAVANNMAAKLALAPRLLLLNSDTVVLHRAIDRLMSFARSQPAARVWGGRTVFGDGSLNYTSAWGAQTLWSVVCFAFGLTRVFSRSNFFNPEALSAWRRDTVREVDIVTGCFLLIDTDLWRQLDGFDQTFFMYGEEADLCARARRAGARPLITPEATIVHYGGGSSSTRVEPTVRILKAKIALARRSMSSGAAAAVRWLYASAVLLRLTAFRVAGLFNPKARAQASMWQAAFARRSEWL